MFDRLIGIARFRGSNLTRIQTSLIWGLSPNLLAKFALHSLPVPDTGAR